MTGLFLIWLTSSAWASMLDLRIGDMICNTCEGKISEALDELPFLESTTVSCDLGQACAEIKGPIDENVVSSTLKGLGYSLLSIEEVELCELQKSSTPQNWQDSGALDVQIISSGETVELDDHRSEGKFTIYDFAAPWCGPCHVAEKLLKQYLSDHSDTAVRAIVLDSKDPKTSFNMPAAKQHLSSAPGLPYFVVVDPKGKVIYRGVDVPKAMKQIDKRR